MSYFTVKFTNLEEFIGELRECRNRIYGSLVRCTFTFRHEGTAPCRTVRLVASAIAGQCVLRYEAVIGELWGTEFLSDAQVREEMEARMASLQRDVKLLALDVRAGIIETA